MNYGRILIWVAMLWAGAAGLHAQATTQVTTTTVRGRVEVIGARECGQDRHGTIPGTVVWLTPITRRSGRRSDCGSAQSRRQVRRQTCGWCRRTRVSSRTSWWFLRGRWWSFPIAIPFSITFFHFLKARGLISACTRRALRGWCDSTGPESATFSAIFIPR